MGDKMNALEVFRDYELAENLDELFAKLCLIQDAKAKLREIESEAKEEMMRRMKEEGVREFRTGPEGQQNLVRYGRKVTHKIKDTRRLIKMLWSANEAERDLSKEALAGGQSVWKIAQVRVLCDTLGIDDLIETQEKDELELKVVPIDQLKAMGVIK